MENEIQVENKPVSVMEENKKTEQENTPSKGEKRPLVESNADITEPEPDTERIVKRPRITREVLKTVVAPTCTAPVPWKVDVGSDGSALYLDERDVLMGTVDGKVLFLDLEGRPRKVVQLPCPVGSIFRDGKFVYAWCHAQYSFDKWKGALFDLSGDDPRVLFDFQDYGEWVKFAGGHEDKVVLCDDKGSMVALGPDGNVLWKRPSTDTACKVVLVDGQGVYVGYQKRVVRHSWGSGDEVWSHCVTGRFAKVLNGAQDAEHVYVEAGGKVVQLDKSEGQVVQEFTPARHRASGVCVGNGVLVTGSCPTVVFDLKTGEEIVRINLPGRMADAHMKMHPSGRLIIAWDDVSCVDLTKASIQRAMEGKSTRTNEIKLAGQKVVLPRDVITMTREAGSGVIVKCVENAGKLEVFPLSEGYEKTWSVRFPVLLRFPGIKYVVDELIPSEKYKFYSVLGEIRELVEAEDPASAVCSPRTPRPIRSKPNTPLAATPSSRLGSRTATPQGPDTPRPVTTASGVTSPSTPCSKLGALQLDTPTSSKTSKLDKSPEMTSVPVSGEPKEDVTSAKSDDGVKHDDETKVPTDEKAEGETEKGSEAMVVTPAKSSKQALGDEQPSQPDEQN